MMNNISLSGRSLNPIESKPAIIIDYKLIFMGRGGMAAAVHDEGSSFHGVLHLMSSDNMIILDKIESGYNRETAKAKLYNGEIKECTV